MTSSPNTVHSAETCGAGCQPAGRLSIGLLTWRPLSWRGHSCLPRRDSSRRFRNRTSEPHREQGSALLIVFVLAAAIAIMLYRELPVAITEGQRQKEQLLIDRGGQYERAIQLYFRNRKSYPPS